MGKPQGFFSDEEIEQSDPRLIEKLGLEDQCHQREAEKRKRLQQTQVTRQGLLYTETKPASEWAELEKLRSKLTLQPKPKNT